MTQPVAPPPVVVDGRRVVPPDVERIDAALRFDLDTREAVAKATVHFTAGGQDGHPALDLRQPVEWLRLDGTSLDPSALPSRDLGAEPGAEMRVLDVSLEAGSPHRLEIGYRLEKPTAAGAEDIGWQDEGVRFDLWMSDLRPGRYLEMWVPAPLVHDRFALSLAVELLGKGRPHTLIANTGGVDAARGGKKWSLRYPAHFTSLSPMLILAPSDQIEVRRSAVVIPDRERSLGVVCARSTDIDVDLEACAADLRAWLVYLSSRYGPWTHGDTFWALLWAPERGMEYDGATTSSVKALEHEVFHSWFGRGVKPARAADGWIDEAWTTWATSTRSSDRLGRFETVELGLDEPPVELYPPSAWSRHTPLAAYTEGARLFAGLAALLGGPERLRAAMADWYRVNLGGFVTTNGLAAHLAAWSGIDIGPWWARYVHGRG